MNQKDRKRLIELRAKLEDLVSQGEEIANEIEDFANREQEKYDNLSEGLQQSERGQQIEGDAETLASVADALKEGNIGEGASELNNIEGLDD